MKKTHHKNPEKESPWLGKYAKPFGIIPAEVRKLPGALGWKPSVTAVYFNLFLRGGPTNWKAYPAVNTIAKELNIDRRTVQRALRFLEQSCVIRGISRRSNGDSGVCVPSNVYDLRPVVTILDALASEDAMRDDENALKEGGEGDDGPDFDDRLSSSVWSEPSPSLDSEEWA